MVVARERFVNADDLYRLASHVCDCDDPACGLPVSSKCHPDAGVHAKYFRLTRALQLRCVECGAFVTTIDLRGTLS